MLEVVSAACACRAGQVLVGLDASSLSQGWESRSGGHCYRKVMFVSYFQAKISSVSSFTWLFESLQQEESQCCAFNLGHSRRVL